MSDLERSDAWIDVALASALLRADHAGRIVEVRGSAGILPVAAPALLERRIADIDALPYAMRDAWTRALERCFDTQRPQMCGYALDRNGATRRFEARMMPLAEGGAAIGVADVGERDRLRERVEHLALHDPVTGLGNARVLRERLVDWLGRTPPSPVALLIVDLDRFRQTHDLYGRSVGDALLRVVSQRMRREAMWHAEGRPVEERDDVATARWDERTAGGTSPTDEVVVVRLGGDQFAVAWRPLRASNPVRDDAAELATRLIGALAAPSRIAGQMLFVRASIGIAVGPGDARDAPSLFALAEAALRNAKQGGRNQFRRHGDDAAPPGATGATGAIAAQPEAVLRDALASGEFRLVYQPKFELASSLTAAADGATLEAGALIAVEALCRWRTASGVLLAPVHFLSLAESSGLIRPLGDWVLDRALAEVSRLGRDDAASSRIGLSVNVSLSQLRDRGFVDGVAAVLQRYRFPPAKLTLEISETAFVEDWRLVADVVAEVSALGVKLAIDHFGIGTAGLVALKAMPVDEIKIDRSFIAGAAIDAFDAAIVAGLIELAHNLGMTVTAEGVERIDQIGALAQMRCDAIQGYFVGEPMTIDVLVPRVDGWRRGRKPRASGDA